LKLGANSSSASEDNLSFFRGISNIPDKSIYKCTSTNCADSGMHSNNKIEMIMEKALSISVFINFALLLEINQVNQMTNSPGRRIESNMAVGRTRPVKLYESEDITTARATRIMRTFFMDSQTWSTFCVRTKLNRARINNIDTRERMYGGSLTDRPLMLTKVPRPSNNQIQKELNPKVSAPL
jgi:hypothetical protein